MVGGSRGCAAALLAVLWCATAPAGGQATGGSLQDDEYLPVVPEVIVDAQDEKKPEKDLLLAPIPVANPTIGNGLVLVAARMFRYDADDTQSPKSWFGIAAGYTDTESWAVGAAHRAYLNGDRWRVMVGGGLTTLNYDFFGVGDTAGDRGASIPIEQEAWVVNLEVLRNLSGRWYGGLRYLYADTTTVPALATNLPQPPEFDLPTLELDLATATIGLHVQRDGRDSSFFATSGSLLDLRADFYDDAVGSDREFERYTVAYNKYFPIAKKSQVLAFRVAGCRVPGDAPFFSLCQLGASDDIRGYTGGRYRDTAMLTTQAEWRYMFHKRFGVVAFAGAGEVAPSFDDLRSSDVLPGGGVGLRITAATQSTINVRIDYAWGEDDEALYISVGEAF